MIKNLTDILRYQELSVVARHRSVYKVKRRKKPVRLRGAQAFVFMKILGDNRPIKGGYPDGFLRSLIKR